MEEGQPRVTAMLTAMFRTAHLRLNTVAEALAAVEKTGERLPKAELYRIKGQLSLHSGQVMASQGKSIEEAESCFLKAIEIARRQQAKSLELRVSMSLSRLATAR